MDDKGNSKLLQVVPFLGLLLSGCFAGLDNPGYITEKGREFIVAFVENRVLVDFPIIKLYATSVSDAPVNVTFSVPLMTHEFEDETLELQPGQVAVKQYPYELHMLSDGRHNKGERRSCREATASVSMFTLMKLESNVTRKGDEFQNE